MKFFFLLCSLVMSVLTISCTTQLTDQNAVSDAWLDTVPRASQQPHRPADGVTHWKSGPSIDRMAGYAPRSTAARAARPAEVASSSRQETAGSETRYISSGYTTRYGGSYGGSYRGHHRASNQGFVRTVETVGPPIVPRLSVPTIVRSPQTASNHSYSSMHTTHRKNSHRAGYNRGDRTTANDEKSRGSRGGRR